MSYKFISVCIALFSFVVSFYALSAIDKFCQVEKPAKVQTLLIVLSFALAGLVANFLMMFINF